MTRHPFIFSPGAWHGEGTITFSMAEDILPFAMSWTVLPLEEDKIYFNQIVDVWEFTEKMHNHFCISSITSSGFEIELQNNIVGKVVGKGILTPEVIAWEFRRKDQDFEGFEMYALQPNGSYKMKGEFTSGDHFRTQIQGKIEKT